MEDKSRENKIFNTGRNEIDQMKANLEKLYNLTDEEKSEDGFLQSRIEEQSNLIMMLKKRADEYLLRCQTLDRENKNLESKLNIVNNKNKADDKKNRILFQNYNNLLQTFEDMKSQYSTVKTSNEEILKEIDSLKKENITLAEQLKNSIVSEGLVDDLSNLRIKNEQLSNSIKDLNDEYCGKLLKKQQEIKVKQEIIDSLNMDLKDKEIDLNDIRDTTQLALDKLKNENISYLNEVKNLRKNLETQTLTIKKNHEEITELSRRGKNFENLYKELKEKYQRDSENVNVNLQIQKLKSELQIEEIKFRELRQDYEAYKVYSNKLLQTEKEISSRLRKLYP